MSTEMKRNLIGGAGIAALLTLFMALALWPLWSRGAGVERIRSGAIPDDGPGHHRNHGLFGAEDCVRLGRRSLVGGWG